MATKIVPGEPGPSEFSWGKGIMAPISQGHILSVRDQLRALHRMSVDPVAIDETAEPDYTKDQREK